MSDTITSPMPYRKNTAFLPLVLFMILLACCRQVQAQSQENILYIIDSIQVIKDPEEGDEILESEVADLRVIRDKDTLKSLGMGRVDAAIFIFTKAYRERPEELRKIPSTKQMERRNDTWYLRGTAYTGKFIDYFYSGRKQGEGTMVDGKLEGLRTMYHQNGKMVLEREYSGGDPHGSEKEYYEDGSLKQKGMFNHGVEDGIWEAYFPNGQVKQRSTFKGGKMDGETTVYYSSGRVLAVELNKNGVAYPDKRLEKINEEIKKGNEAGREDDFKNALKHYSKAVALDTTFAESYYARGTAKLYDFQFDEAIADFDKALALEPYYDKALANRAFARMRKYQLAGSRKLSERNGVTVLASKDDPGIPEPDRAKICSDLRQAVFLGDRNKMNLEAIKDICSPKSAQ